MLIDTSTFYVLHSGVKRSQNKENMAPKKRKTDTKGLVMYVVQYTVLHTDLVKVTGYSLCVMFNCACARTILYGL